MIGGMLATTVALSMFGLQEDPALGTLIPAILVALLVAMVGCALLNATIERVAYRPLRRAPRLVPLITAIGVSFILQNVALIWKGSAPVAMPKSLPDGAIFTVGTCPDCVVFRWDRLFPILITVPVLVGLVWLVRYTRRGKAMRATAQDKDAAAMMGIDVNRTIGFVFLLAGTLAGAAGVLFAFYFQTIRYDTGFTIGLIAFTAAVLGGIGNLPGAVLGAMLIGLTPGVRRRPFLALAGRRLDDDGRLHDPDPHPRVQARGAPRRADAPREADVARLNVGSRVQKGFWRALEAVGVRDARTRWERQSPFLQRAVPPLVIAVLVLGLGWLAGVPPHPTFVALLRHRLRPLSDTASYSEDRVAVDGAGTCHRLPDPLGERADRDQHPVRDTDFSRHFRTWTPWSRS